MATRKTILSVALAGIGLLNTGFAHAAAISSQGTWETTLQGRDLDGNLSTFEAYYDTDLDITWLADANYAKTSGDDADGYMNWTTATAWAASLNPYGSNITGWRLPTVSPVDGTTDDDWKLSYIGTEDKGYNISAPGTLYAGSTTSEMAHMFYNTLGDKSSCDPSASTASSCIAQAGYGLSNTGPFSNLQSYGYWSDTEFALNTTASAWAFAFHNTYQEPLSKIISFYAWAVHPGDIAVVPVPAAGWLLCSGLLGLIGVARRKAGCNA